MHALVDIGTNALLALNRYVATIVFLAEAVPNSYPALNVGGKNMQDVAEGPIDGYPKWRWSNDFRNPGFSRLPKDLVTEELRARSRLSMAKAAAIGRVMAGVSLMRSSVGTGTLFQETVYMSKRLEAERLKLNNYSTDSLIEFPHVVQYADYADISIREAADEIIFQAKLDDQLLARTEIFRIRYFNKIKDAQTPAEIKNVMDDYLRDSYLNGKM